MSKLNHQKMVRNKLVIVPPLFKFYKIPLSCGRGLEAKTLVKIGDELKQGTLIAKGQKGLLTANVHSSVCGKVKDIIKDKLEDGTMVTSVVIESNGLIDTEYLKPLEVVDKDSILDRIFDAGIVGMGGAGFPTFEKYKNEKSVEDLIIDICESDDYLGSDIKVVESYAKQIVEGAKLLSIACGANNIYFVIRKNEKNAINSLKAELNGDKNCKLFKVQNKCDVGYERNLAKVVLNKQNYAKPIEANFLQSNVQTVLAVYEAVKQGKPSIERVITISGGAIKSPSVLRVKIGTIYDDLTYYLGGEKYPLVDFKSLEKTAMDLYGELMEMKGELQIAKNNEDYEELRSQYVVKRKEVNKKLFEFLIEEKKHKHELLYQIILGGYYSGNIQKDFNYVVNKNSLGLLLLTHKEYKKPKEKK